MANFVLVDDFDSQLDQVSTSSLSEAEDYFFITKRWTAGYVVTLEEYQSMMMQSSIDQEWHEVG